MARGFRVSAVVDRPQAEVWAFMTNLKEAPTWMSALESVEPLGDGPTREGARFMTVSTAGGRRVERETEVCLWEPETRFALKSEEGGISAVYEYACTAEGERTLVSLDARCTARGLLWHTLHPLITYMMKRSDGDQVERLKVAVESRPKTSDTGATGQ